MKKLTKKEEEILKKDFFELRDTELDIYIGIEDDIEMEPCHCCGGNIVCCNIGSFLCQDCGAVYSIEDYIEK